MRCAERGVRGGKDGDPQRDDGKPDSGVVGRHRQGRRGVPARPSGADPCRARGGRTQGRAGGRRRAMVTLTAGAMTGPLHPTKRLIVKIGSALLVDEATGAVRQDWLDALADDIAALRAAGCEVLVVSSGAIAVGRGHLGLKARALRLEEKQAAAATEIG